MTWDAEYHRVDFPYCWWHVEQRHKYNGDHKCGPLSYLSYLWMDFILQLSEDAFLKFECIFVMFWAAENYEMHVHKTPLISQRAELWMGTTFLFWNYIFFIKIIETGCPKTCFGTPYLNGNRIIEQKSHLQILIIDLNFWSSLTYFFPTHYYHYCNY